MAGTKGLGAIRKLIGDGKLQEASEACRRRLDAGDDAEARYLLAVVTSKLGLLNESVALFEKAVREFPDRSDVAYNFGTVLQGIGKLDDAIGEWTRATEINPGHFDAQFNLGRAFIEKGMWRDALATCERAAALNPENKAALINLGNVNFRLGRIAQAKFCFGRTVEIDPDYVPGWINFGLAELRDGKAMAAAGALQRAVALDPENVLAHFNLGQALLHAGRLKQGYAEVEWRRRLHKLPFPVGDRPPWPGGDGTGKTLLLYGEQGIGDVIHFLRYAGPLADMGARIVLCCHGGLVGIARRALGVAEAVAFADAPPAFDAYAPLMSLPHLLGLEEAAGVPPAPYLTPPPPAELAGDNKALRVGLVWAGNPEYDDDANRSTTLAALRPLLDVPGTGFYSLQVDPAAQAIAAEGLADKVVDLGTKFRDFTDTAAAIQGLDLVVGVDTAVTHLAGALGKPVWLLLPRVPDWRWGREGETTPLYATMRLFRQSGDGGWPPVIARIADALAALARNP